MSLTNCGSKQVRDMFDRDRKELEQERFNDKDQVWANCSKCMHSWKGKFDKCPGCGCHVIKKVNE